MTTIEFQRVARALADPQRLAILERIAAEAGEMPCKRLVQEASVSQATISHHLRELNEAGLIESRRAAQCVYLSLRRETIAAYSRELARRMATNLAPPPSD
ncbi:ArsR/SmtB family transcription factor [Singulisphaera sp. PoT]|uniref:ArsR/SmtB family transcription factor n=1 Tax=Singulisphaera sp. PoT TaxID=3411797 RepID=UPI003BF5F788